MAKLLRLPLRKKGKKEGQGKEIRYSIAGGKERLVFSNPADIELELAAAIEREESSVISESIGSLLSLNLHCLKAVTSGLSSADL